MHLRFKITSVSMRVCVAVVFAIALAVACAAAFAQSPAAGAQTAAASVAATAAPRPAAAASAAAVSVSAAPLTPDAKTVISYLSDVINWYGHLGVEAQLVSEPDETLFFADDRQVASEVLRLAFEYARAQAAFLAKTSPNSAVAATGSTATQTAATGAAGLGNTAQTLVSLEAAATTLRAKIKDLQAQLAKAPARQRTAIVSQIQDLQSELDLNQARLDALKALTEFESGSAAPDQNSGLPAQIDELERSIADSSKKTTTLPVNAALMTRSERTGILSFTTDLFALSNKLDALEENIALAKALAARADGVRKSILASITSLNERGDALARGAGGADVGPSGP